MTEFSSSREARSSGARGALLGLAWWLAVAVLVLPPLLVMPGLKEPFRLPKLVASESLVLGSLIALAAALALSRVDLTKEDRIKGVLAAVVPLVLLASFSRLSTSHPEHVNEALWSLWIGAAALVAWALGLKRYRGLFLWTLVPALLLAAMALYQYLGMLSASDAPSRALRVQMTSRAGSVGDLAAYLVLPCLVAQMVIGQWLLGRLGKQGQPARLAPRQRALLGLSILTVILSSIVLLLSQTLAAIVALGASSVLFWWLVVSDRRIRIGLAGAALLTMVIAGLASPLGDRLGRAADQVGEGQLNALLSGRLDGWWAGLWMLRENPLTGVGHGAYGAAFGATKLAMDEAGVNFYQRHLFPTFGNAHNEFIEVGAELGVPGVLALTAALIWLALRLRRRLAGVERGTRGHVEGVFALTAVMALAILSSVYFPFRLALTAFPAVVLLAWIASFDFLEPQESAGVAT